MKFCYNSSLGRDISRSMRGPLSSDSEDCLLAVPGVPGSSSSSPVSTLTRRSTCGLTTTRFHHKRWRILSNFFIGFIFCWAQFFSMVIKLRLWSYFQFSKHFFIFYKRKASIIHFIMESWWNWTRFHTKTNIFCLKLFPFWVTFLIKGRYKV